MDSVRRIEKVEKEVAEVRKYVNDMSHLLAKVEEDIKWIKFVLKWGLTFICFMLGLSIGL